MRYLLKKVAVHRQSSFKINDEIKFMFLLNRSSQQSLENRKGNLRILRDYNGAMKPRPSCSYKHNPNAFGALERI